MGNPRRNSSSCNSAPRIERKIIEKNRRNRMKILYSNLVSLLPNHTSKVEGLALPDQIDEAVEYIKSMQMKVERLMQKKELLLQGKRLISDPPVTNTSSTENKGTNKTQFEVHSMGQNLDVVLANGLPDYSSFNDVIRFIHQHGGEIASASFARNGNSIIQVLQDKVGHNNESSFDSEGATMSRKLKELISGTCSSSEVLESERNLWDYEIESNIWGFETPQTLDAGTNFGYYEEFLNMGNFNM
ncbi:hypothetical protein ACS0TY_031848 [Phlomoides rotata]